MFATKEKRDKKRLDAFMKVEALKKKKEEENAKKLKKEQRKKEKEERRAIRASKKRSRKHILHHTTTTSSPGGSSLATHTTTRSAPNVPVAKKGSRSATPDPSIAPVDITKSQEAMTLSDHASPVSPRRGKRSRPSVMATPPDSPRTANSVDVATTPLQKRVQSIAMKNKLEEPARSSSGSRTDESQIKPSPRSAATTANTLVPSIQEPKPVQVARELSPANRPVTPLDGTRSRSMMRASAGLRTDSPEAGELSAAEKAARARRLAHADSRDLSASRRGSQWGINTMRRRQLTTTSAQPGAPTPDLSSPAATTVPGASSAPAQLVPAPSETPTNPIKPVIQSAELIPSPSSPKEEQHILTQSSEPPKPVATAGQVANTEESNPTPSVEVSSKEESGSFIKPVAHQQPEEYMMDNEWFGEEEPVNERIKWQDFIHTAVPEEIATSPRKGLSKSQSGPLHRRGKKIRKEQRPVGEQQRLERDAGIIVGAFKKHMETKHEDKLSLSAGSVPTRTVPDESGPAAPPPPPIAPPPPPTEQKATRVNMLGTCGDEFYQSLFGVPKEMLEKVPGIYKWRIETMLPVLHHHPGVSTEGDATQGVLPLHQVFIKDCYLFLHVKLPKDVPPPKTDGLAEPSATEVGSKIPTYHLHYWMGKEASPDKLGTVCVRAVQLNTFLSGAASHHPEPQGEESSRFNEYFGGSVEVLAGGTDSPFRKIPPIQDFPTGPRLYRFFQVGDEDVQRIGMHFQIKRVGLTAHWFQDERYKEDVFLFDTGLRLFQWNGQFSPGWLQHKCGDIALAIRTERQSKPVFELLDSKTETIEKTDAWALINAANEIDKASEVSEQAKALSIGGEGERWMRLHKITGKNEGDIDSTLAWSHEDQTRLLPTKNMLSSEAVYILDLFSEIFIFYGRRSTNYLRQIGLLLANKMLMEDDMQRPTWGQVEEVKEKAEPVLFRARFQNWTDESDPGVHKKKDFRSAHEVIMDEIRKRGAKKEAIAAPKIDPATLFPALKNEEDQAKDETISGSHESAKAGLAPNETLAMGLLESGKTFGKIGEQELGQFFSAECYVIMQTRQVKLEDEEGESSKKVWDIWFWQGKDASPLRFPTFQLGLLPQLQDSIVRTSSELPTVHRVYQEKEPTEFMRLFAGMIVISKGSRSDAYAKQGQAVMYRATHTAEGGGVTRMLEVPVDKNSLDATGTFLLHVPPCVFFIWHGRKASQSTRGSVKDYLDLGDEAEQLKDGNIDGMPQIRTVEDGKESADFWHYLGAKPSSGTDEIGNARLIEFKYDAGKFIASEIVDFSQHDLHSSRCYLLDTFSTELRPHLWMWLGTEVPEPLVIAARHVINSYVDYTDAKMQPRITPKEITEGEEPTDFTKYFTNWTRVVFVDPYAERQKEWRAIEQAEMQARALEAMRQAQLKEAQEAGQLEEASEEEETSESETESETESSDIESDSELESSEGSSIGTPVSARRLDESEDAEAAQRLEELERQRELSSNRLKLLQEQRAARQNPEAAARLKAQEERRRDTVGAEKESGVFLQLTPTQSP
eukprot:TRINITY_DN14072_c0_g1_i1.p1 TRINITY_DN14072_c0_g1~~TRINITY_DN14072_c0_g1_i1.p1  ORF type:complete len:1539 (+),score=288.06 TRINITY_DN14072_c0_g1_i1:134-4750(+)